MYACKGGHKDVVQLLLDHSNPNVELNGNDICGITALAWACKNGHKDVVQLLLDHSDPKIDLSPKNSLGWTALMNARRGGHKEIIQLMEQKRAGAGRAGET